MPNTINNQKKELRKILISKRLDLRNRIDIKSPSFYKRLESFSWFNKSKVIASFMSIKSEISTDILNNYIQKSNKILCLPVMKENSQQKLIFMKYTSKKNLNIAKYGVKEPIKSGIILPDIIFTPCLGFDMSGYRLGYGGGYYDQTIYYLKSIKHQFITVGFAFDEQRILKVPHDDFDQKLNYIFTEKQLYKIL